MRAFLIAAAMCVACTAASGRAQSMVRGVRIDVSVGGDGSVIVRERYRVPPDTGAWMFRMLTRPCVRLPELRLVTRGFDQSLVARARGPWLEFSAPADATQKWNEDTVVFESSYVAWLTGGGTDIPLAHLARPLASSSAERAVSVEVDLAPVPGATVTFPTFEHHANNKWRAQFVAIPSYVRVERPGNRSWAVLCDSVSPTPRDDGGLTWRFWLFVGIMAAWVPLYLTWARRSGEPGEPGT